MKKRNVIVYEYIRKTEDGRSYLEKTETGPGIFHEFGVEYEELEMGVGTYSTAIIEMPNGTIKNVPVENITFTD